MQSFAFEITPSRKTTSIIRGVFTQFDDHKVVITYEGGEQVKKNIGQIIEKPLNYLARMTFEKYESAYKKVANLHTQESVNIKSKAQIEKEQKAKLEKANTLVYKLDNGVTITEETLNSSIEDINGNKIKFANVVKVTPVYIPSNGKYTKSDVLNRILSYNAIPYDIDRSFIRSLQNVLPKLNEMAEQKDAFDVVLSKRTKKYLREYKDNQKLYSDDLKLTILKEFLI